MFKNILQIYIVKSQFVPFSADINNGTQRNLGRVGGVLRRHRFRPGKRGQRIRRSNPGQAATLVRVV